MAITALSCEDTLSGGNVVSKQAEIISRLNELDLEAWKEVGNDSGATTFGTGWASDASKTVRYRKQEKRVYLSGMIRRSSGGLVKAFALPAGYRPAQLHIFPQVDLGGNAKEIQINSAGDVQLILPGPQTSTPTQYASLDGIFFFTD